MNSFSISSASVVGTHHSSQGHPNQDAHRVIETPDWQIGFLADGCGSAPNSQVGSQLAAYFLAHRTQELLRKGIPLGQLPSLLFSQAQYYLRELAFLQTNNQTDFVEFVRQYLYFTIIGVVSVSDQILILTCGDGIFFVDDVLFYIDQNNAPSYLGKSIIKDYIQDGFSAPEGFNLVSLDPRQVSRLLLGSDAWKDQPDLLSQIPRPLRSAAQLQLKLNQFGLVHQLFDDDATLIVLDQKEPKS